VAPRLDGLGRLAAVDVIGQEFAVVAEAVQRALDLLSRLAGDVLELDVGGDPGRQSCHLPSGAVGVLYGPAHVADF
jgi:hypothetical protein